MKFILGIVLAVVFSVPACADWQFTKWGMTPAQVIAGSDGAVSAASQSSQIDEINGPGKLGAGGKFSSGAYKFASEFYFDEAGLLRVKLYLLNTDRSETLVDDLRGKYANLPAAGRSILGDQVWRDDADNYLVSYNLVPLPDAPKQLIVVITYERIKSSSANGL